MLRIQLHQFRCWDSLTIDLPIGGITLIKGSSGVGKTTLLQAITWCLYGNIRMVTPTHHDTAKTNVIISLPHTYNGVTDTLIIDRRRNPNRLMLTHGHGTMHEDKVAQAIINEMFGTHDIWMASCYIGQGCRNNFLTAPNTGKMELLNTIAFHEEDPTFYIERIDSKAKDTGDAYNRNLAVYTDHLQVFNQELSVTDTTKALSVEAENELRQKLTALSAEKEMLTRTKTQREIDIGILGNAQRQLDAVTQATVTVPQPNEHLLQLNATYGGKALDTSENIDALVASIQDIIPSLRRRDDLKNAVIVIDNMLVPFVNMTPTPQSFTEADLQRAITEETMYRDSQRVVSSLGVMYSANAIAEAINNHRRILGAQERWRLEAERNNLVNIIAGLETLQGQPAPDLVIPEIIPQEIPLPDYSAYNTEPLTARINGLLAHKGELTAHINHLQRGRDVLSCPQCTAPLRYTNNSLSLAETGPADESGIQAATNSLTAVNSEIAQLQGQMSQLQMAETAARQQYEAAVLAEQRRIDQLKEQGRLAELEQQRRMMEAEARRQKIAEQREQLVQIENKLALLPPIEGEPRVLSPAEVDSTHAFIGKLESITLVSPPAVSSEVIRHHLQYQELQAKRAAAVAELEAFTLILSENFRADSLERIQNYIAALRQYSSSIRSASEEHYRLEQTKKSLTQQIEELLARIPNDPSPRLTEIEHEIVQLSSTLTTSEKARRVLEKYAEITRERDEVVKLNEQVSDLQVFRQHAVNTECYILQEVVNSINASIEGVCNTLFEQDINISLQLFKTAKTTKNVKPMANFTIAYRGGTFDNISQLSGGEGDRASLALTLALNRLSPCPFMMLDESLASLDLDIKEAAIRTIRENTNNTVLIILHDGIEGIFDHVVDMSAFR